MKEFRDFLLSLFGIVVAMTTGILVMIFGWGLQPESWTWIIGLNFLGHFIAVIFDRGLDKSEQ